MSPIGLRNAPSPDDDSWVFRATIPTSRRVGMGKHITFSPQQIKLDLTLFPANRILQEDDPNKFVLASFEQLRFPEKPASVAREYMLRFFKAGLLLNGVQYRFYGHSNSQLRSRSCFLREANADDELDDRIYRLGDFQRIMNAAKRAKRIGLLFSEAKMDWILDPLWTKDIDDITSEGEVFSDGCGLISTKFAVLLSKHKRIIFRVKGYTPCVYQIRLVLYLYLLFDGVLMIHPLREDHVHFRKSQKKFTATGNNTFSVVNYSVPYAFARLNNDIVVLLSSLGVTTEKFVAKQREYFQWITEASTEWEVAFDFLSALGKYNLAERVLLDGIDDDRIQGEIHRLQRAEMASFKKNERLRVRTLVQKSRFLFGVCDPYGVLKPGEVHVRLTIPRKGAASLTNVDVLVVRNPCLHPGDCLKLRAVRHPKLDHLVDCLVFSSRGKRAAPSMSSGGDLDGDQFTVIWDPDLVPPKVAESYTYPPGREHISNNITRQDLAKHFAAYNSMMLGRITTLHQRWMRVSPKGAMCAECQELNALHSSVVDGGSIKIPERLTNIPDTPEDAPPFVLDVLHEEARRFCEEYEQQNSEHGIYGEFTIDEAEEMIARLLSSRRSAVSEYEVLMNAAALAKKHSIDISRFLCHVDFGALTTAEKHAASIILKLSPEQHPYIWNSLVRSDILQRVDLESRDLGGPLRLQRLYTSQQQGRAAFFEYLREAVQDYNRRLIVIKMDARFSVGIFLRGEIAWEDEPEVNDNVLVCSFMPYSSTSTSSYKRSTKGYKLHCSENTFQLYNHQRGDTFIFITRPPAKSGVDIITSIALQKISAHVLKQCGRVNRTPVTDIEIHVVSNRDRVGHQMFDLRFEYVETEEYMRRFDHRPQTYVPSTLLGLDWSNFPDEARIIFTNHQGIVQRLLSTLTDTDLYKHLVFAINYRAEDRAFWIFEALVSKDSLSIDLICQSMDLYPDLAFLLLKRSFLEGGGVPQDTVEELASSMIKNIIRSANHLAVVSLVGLEKMAQIIDSLDVSQYFQLLWLSCLSVRSSSLVQEVLLVLQECRETSRTQSAISEYAHKHGMAIVFDRAEEASDSCPCDEGGRPKRSRREKPTRANTLPATITIPPQRVMAHIRVDAPSSIRIHSHVRMQVVSPPEHSTLPPAVLDATVIRASRGEVLLEPLHPLPPEYASVDWNLYCAGSIATSKAMLDAVQKLAMERSDCCSFYDTITGAAESLDQDETILDGEAEGDGVDSTLNESQRQAISLARAGRMTLIWGPPGMLTNILRVLQIMFETSF
ncbi:RNA-directed RNA polymerase [Abortiporus biennis]|nr:RNA-directed RNA polymerase [Abortiporus biennis]